nr:alpha/beta hydrolase [Microbacterium testaceum]
MIETIPLRDASHSFVELYTGLTYRQFDEGGLLPGGQALRFDLFKPVSDAPVPLLVFIKGGGFKNSHRSRYIPALTAIAESGVAVASLEYRTSNQATFSGSVDDVLHGIRYLRSQSARLGIDARRVALWGNSAGATLAVHAAASLRGSESVVATAAWYGVHDPSNDPRYVRPGSSMWLTLGDPRERAWFRPADVIHAEMPPTYLVHGTADEIVSVDQSRRLAAELERQGLPHELLLVEGAGHSFAQMCTRSDALTRTTAFLRNSLKRARSEALPVRA